MTANPPVRRRCDSTNLGYTRSVLPRLWIALLALLLLAGSAESMLAESPDTQASSSLCDDEAIAHVQVLYAETTSARTVCAATPDDGALPAPDLARVFRPPRLTRG